ncbi:hypothetical protein HJC23_008814, partial [Cyclotella cryptica]
MWTAIMAMIQQSNSRMEAMEERSIRRFERLESRLSSGLAETRASTDEQFQTIQRELRNMKGDIHKEISTRMEEVCNKMEGSLASAQADLVTAQEDIQKKMEEVQQIHAKTKDIAKLAHEARNKYELAMKRSDIRVREMEETVQTHCTQIRQWGTQMQQHSNMMDQVGTVQQLLHSVEARQQEMEQMKQEINKVQTNINKASSQWKQISTLAAQSKENSGIQQALQKQTTKLENDVVQAHAYWKKQWNDLHKRMQKLETNKVDDLYIKQIAVATVNTEAQSIKNQCETAADEYTKELKEYMERAAQVYHDDLVKCGMEQQTALEHLIQTWTTQRNATKDPARLTKSREPCHVPEQVEINTNESQMGMSCRSIDPPDEAPMRHQSQRSKSTMDVRVHDDVTGVMHHRHQQDDDTLGTPQQNRWSQVEAPEARAHLDTGHIGDGVNTPHRRRP